MNDTELQKLDIESLITDDHFAELLHQIIEDNPMENNVEWAWNDIGLSELFAKYFSDTTLYCPEARKWYAYNGEKWVKDDGASVVNQKLKQFTQLMILYCAEMAQKGDPKVVASYTAFISRLGNRNVRDRVLKDAQTSMTFSVNRFDADPYLLNCKNGTYNLKTKQFHFFDPNDYLTFQTNCYYPVDSIKTTFTRWDEFIDEIMCGDKELAHYLQKCLGYSLSGISKEEKMFIFYGQTTRNGKSTLINTISNILGDYATTIDIHFICKSKYAERNPAQANPALCSLKGIRFLSLNESDDGSRLDEALVKNYTGNDPISTRQLYGENFTFIPQFTMFISGNNLPDIVDRSIFSSERVSVIPFNRHFNKEEQDKDLKQKLLEDDAKIVIFKWLLDGYDMYTKEGLNNAPAIVDAQVEQYEKDNDITALFLDDKVDQTEMQSDRVNRQHLYNIFKIWCQKNGVVNIKSSQKFYKDLERLGYQIMKSNGQYFITNILIKKEDTSNGQ